jgi:hypothetical protein
MPEASDCRRRFNPALRGGVDVAIFRNYVISVKIVFDPVKRGLVLRRRGLDFASAADVFDSRHATASDDRRDYGEPRFITAGELAGRLVVIVWTPRGDDRRVISMRYAHAKETRLWRSYLE